jgi:hypothetical protein
MREIKTKSEADELYRKINSEIDKYIGLKINPEKLKKYFSNKNKVKNFLVRIGLDNVEKIETILKDVIEDREAGHKENVIKFENFFINESLQFEEADIEYEKVVADLFHTNLSDVEIIDGKLHTYKVNDLGETNTVAIYSEKDIQKFKSFLLDKLVEDSKKNELDLFQTDLGLESGKQIKTKIKLSLSDLINEPQLEELLESELDDKKLLYVMTQWLNDYPVLKKGIKYHYYNQSHNYHIWILKQATK